MTPAGWLRDHVGNGVCTILIAGKASLVRKAALFSSVAGASAVLVGLAAVHLRFWPPKLGHLARMGWSP